METAPLDLDRSDLKNLASFFARRFPSPSERAQLSGAAGLGWTETAGLEPVAAWTELILLARQRKSMPVLAWAAVEARKQDTNLAEVCQVLGAHAPEAGPHFGRSTVRNAVAAAFLVGLSLVGFGVLERQRAAPDGPSDAERFAALEEAASLGEAAALEATAPVGGLVSVAVPAAGAAAPRPWAEGSPLDKNSGAGLTPVAPAPTVVPTVAPTVAPTVVSTVVPTTATAAGSGFVAVSPAAAAPVVTPVAAPPAKAAPVVAAPAKAAPVVVAPAKAAPVVAAPAKAAPVAPAPAVAKVSSPPAATPSSASFPITAPVGEPDGRCKVKGGGLVGWWYAGAEKPGRAGEVIRVTRSANVRATRPDPSNGWNFQSTMRCSVMAGDRLRISGEPVLVNGEAWWVPLQSGDLNPA